MKQWKTGICFCFGDGGLGVLGKLPESHTPSQKKQVLYLPYHNRGCAFPEGLWEQYREPHWRCWKPDSNPAWERTEFKPGAQQKPLFLHFSQPDSREPQFLRILPLQEQYVTSNHQKASRNYLICLSHSESPKEFENCNQGLGGWLGV